MRDLLLSVILVLFLAVWKSPTLAAKDLAVVADPEFRNLVSLLRTHLDFTLLEKISRKELCSFEKALILGPAAYLRVQKVHCPSQKRYLAGVLYPSLFGLQESEITLISPLPSCRELSRKGRRWVTVYSSYMAYYVEYLSSCLSIRGYLLEDPYDLPEALEKIRREEKKGAIFLILPDPVLIDSRGLTFLIDYLRRYPLKTFDLLGLEGISTFKFSLSEKEMAQTIARVLKKRLTGYHYCGE